ncbi:efflux RND transporter periplasmic adaptor subunit [Photobacterium sanguinicancri]|uniref:efflux RND transporter periplasmic adaptor subunit n=1 Tax=Photobacterium sanguinicancri TaxID=875932 RepID=UPI0026E13735|nr:efflux RND transporter periplasmic adaptor subunit [Photobacterium sanguinicancri]MDO6499062.1 efflux RND transporter periplasmic adaptor subunit [Photobacterium sanguinicancri]
MLKKMSFIALSMLFLQGCQEPPVVAEQKALAVSTLTVSDPVESQYRIFNGQVEAAENTPLSFRVEGELKSVLVNTGHTVKKGQLLAELDASKFEQKQRDASVQYALASKQLERGRELFSKKMISKAEFDELNANQRLTKVALDSANARLNYTRLTAPFDGMVSSTTKESFEAVSPGEAVLSLYQNNKVYINIPVSDNVIAMINPAENNTAYQPMAQFGSDKHAFPVRYFKHNSELEPQTQTYRVWFEMSQQTPAILPGTSVALRVNMAEAGLSTLQGYQLPMIALQAGNRKGQFFVWKQRDGLAHKVEVGVEQVNNQGVIASSGVEFGDVLITSSLRKLREGMPTSTVQPRTAIMGSAQ